MRRALATTVLIAAGALVPLTSTAAAQAPAGTVRDGMSQPMYSYANAIRETAWVPTGHDEDGDGQIDRVAADIIRPSEAAAAHLRVPVLMDSSPYYACCGRGNELQKKTYTGTGQPVQFPLFYDNYFVPRGYAVVLVDQAGTNRSSGCDVGPDSTAGSVAVIDWLNGRRTAYTSPFGTRHESATWSNGKVGMFGKSDDGALAIDTAATGVRGLKTIVPIAGVARLYDVFNPDGAYLGYPPNDTGFNNPREVPLCKPIVGQENARAGTSGDFNAYWHGVDSLSKVGNFRASVFATQGFGDVNVDPVQFGKFWRALTAHGIERKAWLHQGAHVDPFDLRRDLWVLTIHRWFDHYLMGVDNGIEREPRIDLETSPDVWTREADWPSATSVDQLHGTDAGLLTTAAGTGTAIVHDNPKVDRYTWIEQPTQHQPYRAAFRTAPLTSPLHLSGTPTITVTASSSLSEARLGAVLVDYGPSTVRDDLFPDVGIRNLKSRSCYGESATGDSACFLDTVTKTMHTDAALLAAGWGDLGHYASLEHRRTLVPGRDYTLTFTLSSLDHTIPAGHRLGLVVGGTDYFQFFGYTDRPTLTIDLAHTTLHLPAS